jgi:GNAT superfamily N-acetyltransferase
MHCLENPIWSALTTRQSHLALGDEYGKRYPREFSPLAGVGEFSQAAFDALAKECGESDYVALCFPEEHRIPDGWKIIRRLPCLQMICEKLLPVSELDHQILIGADVPQMKALVKLTEPGPFSDRTIELGRYIGIKDGNMLVAMAGERMKISNNGSHYDEVSAVCTHPDYRGRGYAKSLSYSVAKNIAEARHTPILHVRSDNTAAIRTYEALGFYRSREFTFAAVAPPA